MSVWRGPVWCWAMALLLALPGRPVWSAGAAPALLDFSPAEVRRILSHGPWPPPAALDPGNAQAGRPAAIILGQQLFLAPQLSPDRRFACASCHVPALHFTDGRPRSVGREPLQRNAPSLWNAGFGRWYGWDGAADSLWSQALLPLQERREMASSATHVSATIDADATLACWYRRVFHPIGAGDLEPETVLVNAAKAIGAFVGSLVSGKTAFDHFRDALARGDRSAAARYPLAAQRGLRWFVGEGRCSTCHVGPLFSNGEFADIGLPFFVRPGVVDPGRHGGLTALRASAYNLLSSWSDANDADAALKTRHVVAQHRNFGEFKVPSLRNVAQTAPYMHDGQLATLEQVALHYSELDLERLHADGDQILRPLRLQERERADLVAFLRTLTDPRSSAWKPSRSPACKTAAP